MYLIVGLGNPGSRYAHTKHNMGFDVLDELIERHAIAQDGTSKKGMSGRGFIGGSKVMLMKPLTYMNLSGQAVRAYVDYYNIDPKEELIVIYDDTDLDIGKIRIKEKGSAGSHNGMKDIISALGTTEFARIRVGIGARPEKWDLADYVLAPFAPEDRPAVDGAIKDAADAVELMLSEGRGRAMEKYNRKEKKPKKADAAGKAGTEPAEAEDHAGNAQEGADTGRNAQGSADAGRNAQEGADAGRNAQESADNAAGAVE